MVANAIAEGKPGYEKVRDYLIPTWHQPNVQCVVKNSKLREGESTNKQGSSVRDSSPDEVAGLVSYLVSAEAAMITGQSVRLFAFLLLTLSKCFWHFKVSINGGIYFDWCTSWNYSHIIPDQERFCLSMGNFNTRYYVYKDIYAYRTTSKATVQYLCNLWALLYETMPHIETEARPE